MGKIFNTWRTRQRHVRITSDHKDVSKDFRLKERERHGGREREREDLLCLCRQYLSISKVSLCIVLRFTRYRTGTSTILKLELRVRIFPSFTRNLVVHFVPSGWCYPVNWNFAFGVHVFVHFIWPFVIPNANKYLHFISIFPYICFILFRVSVCL